jgi:hypothetical protein
LQNGRTGLKYTIPAGILIFGITITNLTQACILYFLETLHIKPIFKFVITVLVITLLLNYLQAAMYPNAEKLTISNLLEERTYKSKMLQEDWRAIGRFNLITRSITLYGMIAPQPYILTDELGRHVPHFRTFKIELDQFFVAGYKGFSDYAIKFWITLLGFAIVVFFYNLIKTPRHSTFQTSLALCIAFNVLLHIFYGDDPMLYTPNWAYALVLFVSVTFEKWAENKWVIFALLVLLASMIYINIGLIYTIMDVSAPYYGK